jgi:cysteinyl-tRNA synthetase
MEEPELVIPPEIVALAEDRWQAKQNREWEKADSLRSRLLENGWQILDSKDGFEIQPAK